jgi:hypothetical protein
VRYCVECAAVNGNGRLFSYLGVNAATGLVAGFSVCTRHGASDLEPITDRAESLCEWCDSSSHRAWLVIDGVHLCVRHGADAWFPDDDMGAHDMAHGLYLQLHAEGVRDTY